MDDLSLAGIEHFNAGRFAEALASFRAALANGDEDPQTRVFLAHVQGALGRRGEAVAEFSAAIAAAPRHLGAYTGLAGLLLRGAPERDAAAEKTLASLIGVTPGGGAPRARLSDALKTCAETLRALGDLERAEKALARALALKKKDPSAKRGLVEVLHRRGQSLLVRGELAGAQKELRRALALEPGHAASRRALSAVLFRASLAHVSAGRLEAAEAVLRDALRFEPRAEKPRRQLGKIRGMREREEKAKAVAARRKTAQAIRALSRRGEAAVASGRLRSAVAPLKRALDLAPRDGSARRQLAQVLRMREQAELALRKAAAQAKAEKVRVLLEKLKAAGQAYSAAERARKAKPLLAAVLALDPRGARAHYVAGGIFFAAGDVAKGRKLLAAALALDRKELGGGETFAALIKLGRYKAAVARAERVLDGSPSLDDLRAFWDPWEWEARPANARAREVRAFERAVGTRSPWAAYYRADLHGPDEPLLLERLTRAPRRRYGWMLAKAGLSSLCRGRFSEARTRLNAALAYKTVDWRTRGLLAETFLCLGRPAGAFAEMDRAAREAPASEAGQVLAWRGLLDLWLGRYGAALKRFDAALRLNAPYALAWRAAALLKLGRARAALKGLDEALALYPRDLEAYVWRGEAKRELGLHREALADLNEPSLAVADHATPIWLWALINRALVKAALGDRPGMKADFDRLPSFVAAYLRKKTKSNDPEELLRAALMLARGFRREEYRQAIWMS